MIDQKTKIAEQLTTLESFVSSPVIKAEQTSHLKNWLYRDLSDFPVQEADLIAQFHENLQTLSELQSKHQFMMREIRYLLNV